MDFYQFHLNTKILFQPGIARDFSNELSQMAERKFLIVSDPFLVTNSVTPAIQAGMEAAGVEVVGIFSEVPPNSELKVVEACTKLAQDRGAEAMVVSRIPGASHCATEGAVIRDTVAERLGLHVLEVEIPPILDSQEPSLRTRLEAVVETARERRR